MSSGSSEETRGVIFIIQPASLKQDKQKAGTGQIILQVLVFYLKRRGRKKLNKWGEQVLITVDTEGEEEEEEEMVNIIFTKYCSLLVSRRGEGGGNI